MRKLKTLIFSDLDGTLLDHYTYQSKAADKTLEQLKNADIPVILNTSKTFAELEIIHQALNLNTPFIIENGAAIYIPINTFNTQPADTVVIDNYWVKSFSLPRHYWLNLLAEHTDEFSRDYQSFSTLSASALCKITGLNLDETERAKKRQFAEPLHWLGDDSTKKAFIDRLIYLGANVVQGGRFIHIGDFCDKGQALIWLTERYREHFDNLSIFTIALGDGENDIAMLEAADIAVQVRSPVHDFPTLYRQYKTTQTQLFGPEGWAEAIQKLLANQLLSPSINSGENHG
ncbi:HAD-IIB family hydrolase [Colwellia sp. 12G3]|uniref:HAD-IIB family hydrolase n=1 Tax=Colwellia sp. 12G3 TaxID=2058299 RepID=UPI000C31BEE3|nr:HAD-IIB family hydrolase [Colwellia sp. 12G3]PKI17325.1 mannosyl-3-phosphoglycerate phosphatase [Colwellia sp. 12G3]